jgi:hypothetical protein
MEHVVKVTVDILEETERSIWVKVDAQNGDDALRIVSDAVDDTLRSTGLDVAVSIGATTATHSQYFENAATLHDGIDSLQA